MYIGFDIGGTKTRIAASRDCITFDTPKVFATPLSFSEGVALIAEAARELRGGESLDAISGGVAGPLTVEKTMLANSPHLTDWIGKPLKQELEQTLSVPVFLENDAALVGLGEANHGAGKGYPIVAYLTVSTGVGGVRIVDGHIDRAAAGFEPGHQIIDYDRSLCPTCRSGELEDYISGTALETLMGRKAAEVIDPEVWQRLADWMAPGLVNATVFWSPDVIVLGGSMIVGDPCIPLERLQDRFDTMLSIFPKRPLLRKATLEDFGGLHGAFLQVGQRLGIL
jgi:glucokinase